MNRRNFLLGVVAVVFAFKANAKRPQNVLQALKPNKTKIVMKNGWILKDTDL